MAWAQSVRCTFTLKVEYMRSLLSEFIRYRNDSVASSVAPSAPATQAKTKIEFLFSVCVCVCCSRACVCVSVYMSAMLRSTIAFESAPQIHTCGYRHAQAHLGTPFYMLSMYFTYVHEITWCIDVCVRFCSLKIFSIFRVTLSRLVNTKAEGSYFLILLQINSLHIYIVCETRVYLYNYIYIHSVVVQPYIYI